MVGIFGGRRPNISEISSEGNRNQYKLQAYIKVTNTYMLEAWNDVAKARLFGRACSMCCASDTWSPSTSSTGVGAWCSTPSPLVLRAAVVDDVSPTGMEEPPCSVDSSCLLLFRGMSQKMSASSVSSFDKVKIARRRLLVAGCLPVALAAASSPTPSTAQSTSSPPMLA